MCLGVCELHSRNSLFLRDLDLWSGSVEHLQQSRGSDAHTRVQVRLRALDVIVEVVTECVYEVHRLVR